MQLGMRAVVRFWRDPAFVAMFSFGLMLLAAGVACHHHGRAGAPALSAVSPMATPGVPVTPAVSTQPLYELQPTSYVGPLTLRLDEV